MGAYDTRFDMSTIQHKACTWDAVREQVYTINPQFCAIVDALSPGSEFTLYKMAYPYGSKILKNGDLCLPTQGRMLSLRHADVSPTVKKALGYNLHSNPVSMVLSHSAEMYIPLEDRVIPHSILHPGDVFGLGSLFDGLISHCPPLFLWDMTAGARSVTMLSKISDTISHRRLIQTFQLNSSSPKNLLDHWSVFTELANNPKLGDPWETELLFFSQSWIDKLKDKAWIGLRDYLRELAWQQSAYWRNQYTSNLIWTRIQHEEGLKPSPYVADIVKHLFAVGVSALPGFAPATDDTLGPFTRIQQAYFDVYRMKEYPPIIMQPEYFLPKENNCVYSSMQFLSAMELSPKSNDRSSTIADLYSVQSLVKKYLRGILDGEFNMTGSRLHTMAKNMSYQFYHSNAGEYPGIMSSSDIPQHDARFAKILKQYPDASFPITGSFLRGCIGISAVA